MCIGSLIVTVSFQLDALIGTLSWT
eukprot:g28667.t1